ncbi:hypothetical protein SAMN05660461_3677 [Chitinophaga ginsengisegetis]|uniref:FAR-17a/AIG1-like protein n=1 Tax=Chitinophaga ginsengisegetis TaxID=393003 RepID=A0A1T5P429_9BACT|nr:Pr6Pr family membrane protein [Chitinophaga ginsengisegetis]SKD07059.1 hypothetical protein SAMN05660461_3677 [Chitinophaga ginsengisegetis]
MSMQKSIPKKILLAILSCLGWFALITQLYLNVSSHQVSVPESVTRYFSYFTLLTNLMVAAYCTVLWLAPGSRMGAFFSRTQTATAITVYITIVALIYNIVLRSLWQPQGLQKVLDQLLHTIIPVLFILYWCVFVKKHTLQWNNFLPWLWYPFIYLVFILIRGAFSGFYPYPFIHAGEIGMQQTLINAGGIAILFMVMSLAFIGIGKLWSRRK